MSEHLLSMQEQVAGAAKPFVELLSQFPDQAASTSGEPVTFSNDIQSQAISVSPVNQAWTGWLNGRQFVRRQEVAFRDPSNGTVGVLSTLERQSVLTRRKTAVVGGRWMVRDQLASNSTFSPVVMTPREVLDNIDTISKQRWYPSETSVEHPRDGFSRQESTPIEQKIQEIVDNEWRQYTGYEANNQLDTASPWDIDLSIDPHTSHSGTIRLARRVQAKGDTSLPADVYVHFSLTPKNNPRLKYGDFPNEGLQFGTAYKENSEALIRSSGPVLLGNEQRAELHALLLRNMNSETLRPDPSKPEFAIPLSVCRDMQQSAAILVDRMPPRNDGIAMIGDTVFLSQDNHGRQTALYVHRGMGSYIVGYGCYDPNNAADRPPVQFQHFMHFTAEGVSQLEVRRIDGQTAFEIAKKILDAGPNPDAAALIDDYKYGDQIVFPEDIARTIADQMRQIIAWGTRAQRGSIFLPN